jgi:hypothetical protein
VFCELHQGHADADFPATSLEDARGWPMKENLDDGMATWIDGGNQMRLHGEGIITLSCPACFLTAGRHENRALSRHEADSLR